MGLKIGGVFDDSHAAPRYVLGHPVVGKIDQIHDDPHTRAIVAIGDNLVRRKIVSRFKRVSWATLVHPSAWIDSTVRLGYGTVVLAGSVIQPDVRIGCHAIVNTCASVDHDCVLSDFVHAAPGVRLAGNVRLDEGVFAGVASTFVPGVRVGKWSILGAGATIVFDLPANVTAVGIPAKVIKERKAGWYMV
ncbi:acetyltransferase [Deinococcus malanensis]|uniref:Acetyltransferase n=2 Tax=Deinococcus malanensis TaxID=1706855 RepID=A0ABQ2ETP2_9DEIO|nr:acetyltransferase [Deinococcus malanensis]